MAPLPLGGSTRTRDGHRGGSRRDLESLLASIQPLIFNVAQKFYLSPLDAEDAAQEIIIKVVTRLDRFDPERGSARAWVLAITRHHLIDVRRASGRMESQVTGIEDYFGALDRVPDEHIPDPNSLGPKQRLLALEANASCLLGMILCLDRDQRLVLIVGDVLGIPGPEAAAVFNVTPGNFRQQLARARQDLYSFMHQRCGLVNKKNPCRCHKKAKGFLAAGWLDPEKRVWAVEHYRNAAVFSEQHAEGAFEGLEERYADQFRGLPAYDADRSLLDIQKILDHPDVKRAFWLN